MWSTLGSPLLLRSLPVEISVASHSSPAAPCNPTSAPQLIAFARSPLSLPDLTSFAPIMSSTPTTNATSAPTTTNSTTASKKDLPQLLPLEEDDEFEEFPSEGQ